jgi:hypothetical protein
MIVPVGAAFLLSYFYPLALLAIAATTRLRHLRNRAA